jgi:serine/threonine-protein kinase
MGLTSGTRVGSYEVRALIGAGGMGEVYRAHDTRLNRDVALKVLPEVFARDSARMARFEREAKLLASLNHPNIAAIYGLEESGPIRALVMELVEGPTLAERIAAGAIPLNETLPIARQVADAVEYAHDNNVIHRDLKPANIKVKEDGMVKVLDFGLAKALSDEPTEADMSNSPTLSMAATRQGVILGTAAYMSPEQAKGKRADRRADIWAFGVVLYEMLTGKPLYKGETVSETMAAVMMKEPSLEAVPAKTPPAIRKLLRRCLDKDARQRLRDMGEARIVIQDVLSGAASIEPVAAQDVRALGRRALLLGASCVVAASVVTGLAVWRLRPVPLPQPVSRLEISLPPNERLTGTNGTMLALSPDGAQLAYVAGAQQRIYLRALDSLETRPLAGTEGALSPFFSPDGQWIGFFAAGKLKRVSVSGGAVLTLCDAPNARGGAWGANDMVVFAPITNAGLSQVSAAGGQPQVLTELKEGELSHRWPQFLPDGKSILYAIGIGTSYDDAHIAAYRLDGGEQRTLIRGGTYPRYVPTGHLVYYRAGTVMAAPFDESRLEVLGTPAPALEGVMGGSGGNGAGQFSFSGLGSLVYVPGGPQAGSDLTMVWVDHKGAAQPLPAPPHAYRNPRLSPDGRQVALDIAEAGKLDIWIYDLMRDILTRLTFEGLNDFAAWTPDGKRVAYRTQRAGSWNIFWKAADNSGAEERLTTSQLSTSPQSFLPDGRSVVYAQQDPKTGWDLGVLPLEGERKPQPFLQTSFNERGPQVSPDGRWVAYSSDESGRYEVYVRPFPGPGGRWQISTDGGAEVTWSRRGNELFYRTGGQREKMMAMEIQTQPSFVPGRPRLLFEGPYASNVGPGGSQANYSPAPDGQRFLMLKATEQQETALTQINVVLNWFEELKRRVPTPQ